MQPDPATAALHEIIFNLHLQNGVDAGEGVDHRPDQGSIPQADKIGFLRFRTMRELGLFDDGDAVEQFA